MAETPADVLVAGYPDIGGAAKDFGSLGALVRDTQVWIDGVILVTHAPEGSVAVRQTCGRLARGRGGAAGPGSRLASSRRRRWSRSPSGLSRAGSSASPPSRRVEQDIHDHSDRLGERCEPEPSRH